MTSCRQDGIDQAVECLEWMHELSKAGDVAATPDIVKYTTIISAYARKGNALQAGNILLRMIADFKNGNKLAKPDFKAFDIVISACTSSNINMDGDHCSGDYAENLLSEMWELSSNEKLQCDMPKASMYKNIIICFKKSMKADKAEFFLREMDHYYKCGKLDAGPTKKLFQTVINAWHESPRLDKQVHLQKLRLEMNERFGRRHFDDNFGHQTY